MKRTRVNIRCVANMAAVRREVRNGRNVIIVPSATLPDDVVMNGIKYPADEIAKSYASLNRTPAPLGHPLVNGKFVSARDPEGINNSWVGAWNENVRREGGRVMLDKVIDTERAGQSDGGKALLNAIDKGEPIHTSTGLLCNLEPVSNAADHKFIARNMEFDHDAILLAEQGAATPEQGVGMFVNSSGEPEEIEVVNSIYDQSDTDLDWAVQSAIQAIQKRQQAPLVERLKSALIEAFSGSGRETSTNKKEDVMPVSEEQFNALSAKVDTLSEGFGKIGETVAAAVANAVKPLTDAQAEIIANQKTKDEAEQAELVAKVVKANVLSEAAAKATPLASLRELAKLAEPGRAANLNKAFTGTDDDEDEFKDYQTNLLKKDA